MNQRSIFFHRTSNQRGLVLMLMVMTLLIGAAAVFYGMTKGQVTEAERDRKTAAALATAKAALIGYATSINPATVPNARIGDLPCPDRNDSGSPGGTTATSCGNASGNQQTRRLGRLPWKTLGVGDLRDGDGERLWYAVSNNFKSNIRTTCTAPGQSGCLNSDTRGTITLRDATGNVTNDGSNPDPFNPSGVIAVVIAPGAPLKRQGTATVQDRSCPGNFCNQLGVCLSNPESNVPKCNPINYLDVLTGVEDNANFTDGSSINGFINGIVRDNQGNVVVNDRLIAITYQDLIPALEKRVAMETLDCLRQYAAASQGRYPWANPVSSSNTNDTTNTTFGRIAGSAPFNSPATYLSNTTGSEPSMQATWPTSCTWRAGTWWHNWREHVFYGIADAYKPGPGTPSSCAAGGCLAVNPPIATADKHVVVVVAGKRLSAVAGGQPRSGGSDKQSPANYVEGNSTVPIFSIQPTSSTFNDTVVFYPP